MEKILIKRIEKLSEEAKVLADQKIKYEQHIQQIDLRLTQLVGAISEMQYVIDQHRKEKQDEGIKDS